MLFYGRKKMSAHRKTALLALAGASVGCALALAPTAFAGADSALDGHYLLTYSADQKTGTGMAARQPEYPAKAKYAFASTCSTGGACVAKVIDAQAPTTQYSQYAQRSGAFTWNGSQWVQQMTSKWDCRLLGGLVEQDAARSTTVLTPGANGTMTGVFHTDIVSGACKGSVEMPVTAAPFQTPVI
jgi:hypothetical protein